MSKKFLSAIIALSSMVVRLDAAVVSLADDFSLSSNPNGNWSYRKDTLLLAFQTPLSNGNPLIPALAPGFWGAGPDLNTQTPEIFKALENGSSIGLNNGDFLAGDIVGHSPNDGSSLVAMWTAPSAGTVSSLTAKAWYAHTGVVRSNDFALLKNAIILGTDTISTALNYDRDHAAVFTPADFDVTAGDIISLSIAKTSGQVDGALSGMALDFTFTPVPEPSTATCLAIGIAFFGVTTRCRRNRH